MHLLKQTEQTRYVKVNKVPISSCSSASGRGQFNNTLQVRFTSYGTFSLV